MPKPKHEKTGTPSPQTVFNLPLDKLESTVNQALAQVDSALSLLQGLTPLDVTGRQKSTGKLKVGEEVALLAIAKVIEYRPAAFISLADQDHGDDPHTVEVQPMQENLERVKLLMPLVTKLKDQATLVADTVLSLGAQVKDVSTAAYSIAKGIAQSDPTVRGLLAPATDYYGAVGRKSARTRAAKQAVRKD